MNHDYLRLYDGDSNSSPMLGQYSGNSIPQSHISSSNKLFIHFQSNEIGPPGYYGTGAGFKLEYHPSSKIFKNFFFSKNVLNFCRLMILESSATQATFLIKFVIQLVYICFE